LGEVLQSKVTLEEQNIPEISTLGSTSRSTYFGNVVLEGHYLMYSTKGVFFSFLKKNWFFLLYMASV
jgi:hypothetical protein